ncbi:MraY family glycosyltransferase [Neobacillus vireti]|uniref:UDP-N-acetylmuramyl pentapeptide phosphotransferase/UDP-N-acetylglucosamine-1-phosphate transferase n=1 Tax=Neobacillus vireti LMG 21834 TaxID=1131730 RepID=A0AB94IL04_9BACI|nr:UDP-N-acetylmuramyl pentapeptide phosphotransferase/UDP-N-acetylglucosamine-1-phosphate transferase [Neobacillus vireti]ETI67761.1 UDP-N-acetylmuramyl pentapeptide phosphotransferase/UDP-N-acetylglucosamine-1-phosphate transferase [Neobacillus vireti LMG 21834]KLT16111.1 UDP-N-acetylmuramyl pentapeptide phosphotransferase [Neobacillus vireti]
MLYLALFIGIVSIVITTKLTQAFKLSSIWGLLGQICASLVIIMGGKLEVSHINLGNYIELGYLTIPLTLVLLVGFTNVMNMETVQNPSILLLPCVSLVCFSIFAFFTGDSFVLITGICASLTIMFILLYGYFSGKIFVGRTLTTSIGFIIAVLSISLLKISIVTIYIPIFTLVLPFTLYYLIQDKITSVQSITVTSLIAILFGVLMFIIPSNILWYLVVGLTIILVITQFSRKYRFI